MQDESTPNMIVSYRMFDRLMKSKEPIQITEILSQGLTADEADKEIHSRWGLEQIRCPKCYQVRE